MLRKQKRKRWKILYSLVCSKTLVYIMFTINTFNSYIKQNRNYCNVLLNNIFPAVIIEYYEERILKGHNETLQCILSGSLMRGTKIIT